jgi:hypothetical protein
MRMHRGFASLSSEQRLGIGESKSSGISSLANALAG